MRVSSGEAVRVCVCVQSVSLQADRSGEKSDREMVRVLVERWIQLHRKWVICQKITQDEDHSSVLV